MISILMPVYNTAPFLSECIESILAQSYKDWELIAIDDFSTDDSRSILESFRKIDSRIQWYANDEKGIVPALEKGFYMSRGEIVHRMDSDDIMLVKKLENLYSLLREKGPGSVATGKVKYFSTEWEVRRGFLDYASWINHQIDQDAIFEEVFMECPIASPAWMMYRKDLLSIGGITSGRYPEDYDLVFRMYEHGLKAHGCDSIVHLWRDWSHRASRTKEEYADQLFFDLKVYYFLKYKYRPDHRLIVWGAGRKGKKLYRTLHNMVPHVEWVTQNENKIGHNIYGTILKDPEAALSSDAQVIVAVSNPGGKSVIRDRLTHAGKVNNVDLFFFC